MEKSQNNGAVKSVAKRHNITFMLNVKLQNNF